jgi:hypothetical protein
LSIFGRPAAGKKDSGTIDLTRKLAKDSSQVLRRFQSKIRWRQFSLTDDEQFASVAFHQRPGGFGAAAFHAENSLTHNLIRLAVFARI